MQACIEVVDKQNVKRVILSDSKKLANTDLHCTTVLYRPRQHCIKTRGALGGLQSGGSQHAGPRKHVSLLFSFPYVTIYSKLFRMNGRLDKASATETMD